MSEKRVAVALAIAAFVLAGAALVIAISRRGGAEVAPDAANAAAKPAATARAYLVDRTHGVVPRQLADQLLADPAQLGTVSDKFELQAIPRGGVLEQLGFHEGDVIRGVNGMEMSAPELVRQLKSSTRLTIDYERGGSALQLGVEIR